MNLLNEDKKALNEKLTYYDLSRLLKDAAEAIDKIPSAILFRIENTEDCAIGDMVSRLRRVNDELLKMEAEIVRADEKSAQLYDDFCSRVNTARNKFDVFMRTLPDINRYVVPHNWEEVIKVAERLSNLSDEQFQRVIELAKAFAPKANQ